MCQIFNKFRAFLILVPVGSKYLIKIIFDIKTKISIFEILNVPNFNKFSAFWDQFWPNRW